MLPKRKALGYRHVETTADSLIGQAGSVARGHEFHYSELGALPDSIVRRYRVTRQGKELAGEGYSYRNCLASYIHLHFGSNQAIAPSFVNACKAYRAFIGDGSVS
jgi:cobyrinic acid a,c-diamide synthase